MGGSKVSVPPPTPEERELQRQQAETLKIQREILEEQRQTMNVLLPVILEQEGFKPIFGEDGRITAVEKVIDPLDEGRKEVEKLLLERSQAALKGELPVDPALEIALEKQDRTLRERLSQQFGPGFETTTPGIQALEEFRRSSEALRFGARTGQLTLAEQLSLSRQQQALAERAQSTTAITQQALGLPGVLAGQFGEAAKGFGLAQQPFIQHRQMQLQAAIANAQTSASMFGSIMGFAGSALGLFSDRRMKEDLIKIGETPYGLPIYEFNFVGEEVRRIGVMADEVEEMFPAFVGESLGYRTVNRWFEELA